MTSHTLSPQLLLRASFLRSLSHKLQTTGAANSISVLVPCSLLAKLTFMRSGEVNTQHPVTVSRIHSLVCDNSWKPHVTPSPQVASPTIENWTRIGGKFLRRRRLLDRASLPPGAKGFFFSWSGAHGTVRNITISCNILLWESLLHYDYLIYSRSDERVSISLVASAKAPGFKQDWSATAVSSLRLTKSRQWLCGWGCKTQKVRVCKAGGRDRERHIRDYGET
jgi:hypothetical protein